MKPAASPSPRTPLDLCYLILENWGYSLRALVMVMGPLLAVLGAVVLLAVFAGPWVAFSVGSGIATAGGWCLHTARKERRLTAVEPPTEPAGGK